MGDYEYPKPFWRASQTPRYIRWIAPILGEHTEEILTGLLGMTAGEIEALREARLTVNTPAWV